MVARSSRVIPTILLKALGKPGAFFNYELQITNYKLRITVRVRNVVEVRCAGLILILFLILFNRRVRRGSGEFRPWQQVSVKKEKCCHGIFF